MIVTLLAFLEVLHITSEAVALFDFKSSSSGFAIWTDVGAGDNRSCKTSRFFRLSLGLPATNLGVTSRDPIPR